MSKTLERTDTPGVMLRGSRYYAIWRDLKSKQRKRSFATPEEAAAFKAEQDRRLEEHRNAPTHVPVARTTLALRAAADLSGTVVDRTRLDELAETINTEGTHGLDALRAALRHAVVAGRALLEASELVRYDDWPAWIAQNVVLSRDYANACMRVAYYEDHLPSEWTSMDRAIKSLRGLPPIGDRRGIRHAPGLKRKARDLVANGMTYSAAARFLGVSATTVRCWVDDDYRLSHADRMRQRQDERRRGVRAAREAENLRVIKLHGGELDRAYDHAMNVERALIAARFDAAPRTKAQIGEALTRLYEVRDAIRAAVEASA